MFKPGDKVEILENGLWVGPFTVVDIPNLRSKEHIALRGKSNDFEHYADEYNTRIAPVDTTDSQLLGWEVGARYKIWTGDIDIVLGYENGWVIVKDEKTGEIRKHLTSASFSTKQEDNTDRDSQDSGDEE